MMSASPTVIDSLGRRTRWPVRSLEDRLCEKLAVGDADECWVWTGACDRRGYGVLHYEGRTQKVHRLAYTLWIGGTIPKHLCVLHKCDNSSCANPAHLYAGTDADNVRDMDNRERRRTVASIGQINYQNKLTWDDVAAIRASDESKRALARRFPTTRRTIQRIIDKEIWT